MHANNVFECLEDQTERRQFTKTQEALKACVKKNLKLAEDMAPLFANEKEVPKLKIPTDLEAAGASVIKKAI